MKDKRSQLGSAGQGVEEIRTLAGELLPQTECLIARLQRFQGILKRAMGPSPCETCDKESCDKACDHLEAHLNGPYEGKLHHETTIGLDFDKVRAENTPAGPGDGDETPRGTGLKAFQEFRKVQPFDAMEPYKSCWDLLTHKQQEAVRLFHGDGMGLTEVAMTLGRAPSSVRGLLDRARTIKDGHNAEMRRKELALRRELETNWREE